MENQHGENAVNGKGISPLELGKKKTTFRDLRDFCPQLLRVLHAPPLPLPAPLFPAGGVTRRTGLRRT